MHSGHSGQRTARRPPRPRARAACGRAKFNNTSKSHIRCHYRIRNTVVGSPEAGAHRLVPPLATTGLPRTPAHAAGLPPPTPHANTGRRLSKSIMRADSQDQENSKGWGMVTLRDSRGIDTEVQPAPRHRPAFTRAHVALLGLHTLRPRDAVSPHACYASSHCSVSAHMRSRAVAQPSHAWPCCRSAILRHASPRVPRAQPAVHRRSAQPSHYTLLPISVPAT